MTKPWSSTSRKRRMGFGCWTFGGNYWFLKYKWKENLSGDVIAGMTMAIIQIPQGKTDILGFLLFLSKPIKFISCLKNVINYIVYKRHGIWITRKCSSCTWNLYVYISCSDILFTRTIISCFKRYKIARNIFCN